MTSKILIPSDSPLLSKSSQPLMESGQRLDQGQNGNALQRAEDFIPLSQELERRGWLAPAVTADSFASARAYAGRLLNLGDSGQSHSALTQIYGLLCPALVTQDAETAAVLEQTLESSRPTAAPDTIEAAEALLAACLPGLLPNGPCPIIRESRQRISSNADFFTRYGYACLGPILASFGDWTWRLRQKAGAGPLLAVLRDGRLLGQAVTAAHPEAADRMREAWLSRHSCLIAAVRSAEDREGLRNALIRARTVPITVGEALDALGLTAERDRKQATGSPFVAEHPLNAADFDAFYDWLTERAALRSELEQQGRTMRRSILEHLDAAHSLDRGAIGLVDVGYAGNLQRALAILLEIEGRSVPVWGAYPITSEGAIWTAAQAGPVWGHLVAYGAPSWLSSLWIRARDLFEGLLAQPEGALIGYTPDGTAMASASALPATQLADCARMQAGALAFVRDWQSRSPQRPLDLAHVRLVAARMFLLPSQAEARSLGAWVCDDALAVGSPRPLIGPVANAQEAFSVTRSRLLWPAGSTVAYAGTSPSETLAAWVASRAETLRSF